MAAENILPELSWLCALLFLAVVIVMVVACVCFKDNEKPQEYGTAGRLSITRDSPVLHFQPKIGGTLSISSRHSDLSSDDGIPKRNSWTVKDRALPEIPDCGTSSQSLPENGIHVNNITIVNEQVKGKSHNKAMAPKPPGSDPSKVFPLNGPALLHSEGTAVHSVTITVNDTNKSHTIGNNISSEPCSNPAVESVPGTSSNMVILKKVEKKESNELSEKTASRLANVYDIVGDSTSDKLSQAGSVSSSPVCIKVESSSHVLNPAPEEEEVVVTSSPSASLAVAGAVPSSDIPYMTPPLLPNPAMSEESDTTGGRSEVPYTVISVREPLARVREITMRKQRAVAVQQNSEDSEDHYAMVPEEEQMYAEIGSGQDSGSSSITYAHIEPRELPPVPPTVESLKSVAHAHSRQASTVSTCSFTSNVSSGGEPASPSILANNPSASLYSTVEKNNKQRKTIHLGEGVSVVTATAEKRKKVEDLYAKVRKKRVNLTISTAGSDDYSTYQGICNEDIECITPPPSPWASTTPPAPPPIAGRLQVATLSVLIPGSSHHVRRHSADPNLPEVISDNRVFSNSSRSSIVLANTTEEPGYERIYNEENNSGDSCYEKIKDESISNGYPNQVHQPNYPGYESVKDEEDPGYESVAQAARESSDPGYELVRSFDDSDSNSDYTAVKLDEIKESDYEVVKNLARSGSDAADPGYEKIKKVPRTDSDATDPGYERVKNKGNDTADPGYETVQRSDSDTDPCYEIVHSNTMPTVEFREEIPPSVTHHANSTILFVSGNSEIHTHHNDPHNRSHTIISESNLTFL